MNLSVALFLRVLGPLVVLAPRRDRGAAARGPAFTTAVRVVDRVHGDAANVRAAAHVTDAAGLAEVLVHVVGVRNRAHRGHAAVQNHAQLARAETDLGVAGVAADQLGVGAGRAGHLAALARLHLDVVDDRADRHRAQRHGVARLHVDLFAGDDRVARLQALRRDDVGLFAVLVVDEGDEGGAVRIVFQALDGRRQSNLRRLKSIMRYSAWRRRRGSGRRCDRRRRGRPTWSGLRSATSPGGPCGAPNGRPAPGRDGPATSDCNVFRAI